MSAEPSNKQPMTTEDLMKPRYKVIADYPGCFNKVGDILTMPDHYIHDFTKKGWCEMNEAYPHLFRKLLWYEDREVGMMPEYVKYIGNVRRFKQLLNEETIELFDYPGEIDYVADVYNKLDGTGYEQYPAYDCEPATKEEFDHYINSQSKK